MTELRIGISGWRYAGWRGTFYPPGLPQARELEHAGRCFNAIEINGSFYSLQRPAAYRAWYEQTPPGFCFAVKGGRFITHMKKLQGVEAALANFFASGLLGLREKLGPILWQLPPQLGFDPERLGAFLRLLPRDTTAAARLARRHDARLAGRVLTSADARRPLRHAIEVRHESFRDPAFIALLRQEGVGLVVADAAGRFPQLEDVTADFVYVRLHGGEELYVSGYDEPALDRWAERIRRWRAGREPKDAQRASPLRPPLRPRDVYVFFDNDAKVRAPFDALSLARRFRGGRLKLPRQRPSQAA